MGADLLSSFEPAPLSALVLFILFTALINLIMVSATSKWAFMSFIFIPMFAQMGIAPDIAQCAFRIGDSSTNAITPFLFICLWCLPICGNMISRLRMVHC